MASKLRAFDALSSREQQMLTLLALVGQPLNRTNWSELLRQLDVRGTDGRALSPTLLGAHTSAWEDAGLIEPGRRGESYVIAAELLHPLLAQLAAQGAIATMAAELRSVAPLNTSWRSLNIGAF
ncbi:MAG TPA: hypothetical protein VFZ61_26115, partial [Polyangiales bacterium]